MLSHQKSRVSTGGVVDEVEGKQEEHLSFEKPTATLFSPLSPHYMRGGGGVRWGRESSLLRSHKVQLCFKRNKVSDKLCEIIRFHPISQSMGFWQVAIVPFIHS